MSMLLHVDALIFSAFEGEMEYYQSHIDGLSSATYGRIKYFLGTYRGKSIALTHVGLGKVQATSSFHFAYSYFKPGIAIFTGTAGAVDLTLKTGSIVIGRRCIDADLFGVHEALTGTPFESALLNRHGEGLIPREYFSDERMVTLASQEKQDWKRVGCLGTSDNFPSPKDKIEALRLADVSTMDMETSAFYHVASLFSIPALAIRSVSNELDRSGGDEDVASADIRTSDRPASLALEVVGNF